MDFTHILSPWQSIDANWLVSSIPGNWHEYHHTQELFWIWLAFKCGVNLSFSTWLFFLYSCNYLLHAASNAIDSCWWNFKQALILTSATLEIFNSILMHLVTRAWAFFSVGFNICCLAFDINLMEYIPYTNHHINIDTCLMVSSTCWNGLVLLLSPFASEMWKSLAYDLNIEAWVWTWGVKLTF